MQRDEQRANDGRDEEGAGLKCPGEGVKAGFDAAAKQLKTAPAKLPAMAPRVLDTDILVKSIGEEIRKAFEAGQASGKGNASETPPRVTSARQMVQRNQHTGEIMATEGTRQYGNAPRPSAAALTRSGNQVLRAPKP